MKEKISPYTQYKKMADDAVALQILEIIEKKDKTSQHKIIRQTGLATGLVHSYMRKVINKGWVKAKQVSAKRWLYYLTPEGFIEKGRLTLKYFSITLQNYRDAQNMVRNHLDECLEKGWTKILVAGANDLAEITMLNILSSGELSLVGVISADSHDDIVLGSKVMPFESVRNIDYDKIIVCDISFFEWLNKIDDLFDHSQLIYPNGQLSYKE